MSDTTDLSPEFTQEYIKFMESKGFKIVHTQENLILLDFDEPFTKENVESSNYGNPEVWELFFEFFPDATWKWSESAHGNTHCVIDLHAGILDPAARIAIQAALGSDPKKEFLSVMRALGGLKEISLLAVKP